MGRKKKKDPDTQTYLFGRPLNRNAREARKEGAGEDMTHAGDPKYHYVKGKGWILKPKHQK